MKKFKILFLLTFVILFIKFQGESVYNIAQNIIFKPNLTASSALLLDTNAGKVLFSKNSDEKMYPASTTKILTALTAVEYGDMNDMITVGNEINLVAGDASKAKLKYGETISFPNLLRALLIPSGNDAAYTIAVHVARNASKNPYMSTSDSIKYFCNLMNKEACNIGATNSHFENPDGYQNPNHYTTAYDLALIAKKALSYPLLKQVMDTPYYTVGSHTWINTDELIQQSSKHYFEYTTAGKTGHTSEAGNCLVSSASKNDKSVISVILKSTEDDEWTDSTKLLKYGLK